MAKDLSSIEAKNMSRKDCEPKKNRNQLDSFINDSNEKIKIERNKFKEQCKEIDYLIYDELYRLQKYLFRSKTLIFLERKFNFTDECLICYDKKIKLILVNEFFGKKGLEIIRYVLILFDI